MINTHSARTAILQAYSVDMQGNSDFTPVITGGRASSVHKIANRYEAGIIIAAVEKQELLRHWLLWAYGPAHFAALGSNQTGSIILVSRNCDIDWKSMRDAVRKRTEALIYCHMDNYRALAITGARKYRKPAHFCVAVARLTGGQLTLDASNYRRDYGYLESIVHDACEGLDRKGLGPVAATLPRIEQLQGVA